MKGKYQINAERVPEQAIADILQLIAALPNQRQTRQFDDLEGEFDYWFDNGACKISRGGKTFVFQDGTRADVAELPLLSLTISFPDGRFVSIQQERW